MEMYEVDPRQVQEILDLNACEMASLAQVNPDTNLDEEEFYHHHNHQMPTMEDESDKIRISDPLAHRTETQVQCR